MPGIVKIKTENECIIIPRDELREIELKEHGIEWRLAGEAFRYHSFYLGEEACPELAATIFLDLTSEETATSIWESQSDDARWLYNGRPWTPIGGRAS